MNFKKLKRLLSVVLSATMILSTNMTSLATELTAPEQADIAVEQETHEHNWQLKEELRAATCDEPGLAKYVCDVEGCTEEKSEAIDALGHDISTVNGVAVCSRCGYNAEQIESNVAAVTVDPAEHTHHLVLQRRVAPTCWAAGMQSCYQCVADEDDPDYEPCEEYFLSQNDTTPVEESLLIIPKLEHLPIRHEAINNNSCLTDRAEYYSCANCKRLYATKEAFEAGAEPVSEENPEGTAGTDWQSSADDFLKYPAGHVYSAESYSFNWDDFNAENFVNAQANGVTAQRACSNPGCNHTESAVVSVTKTVDEGYDCIEGGTATYSATAKFYENAKEVIQTNPTETKEETKNLDESAKGSHSYSVEFDWDSFNPTADADGTLNNYETGVTATRTCSICGDVESSDDALSITITLHSSETFNPATDKISCKADKTMKFTATLCAEGNETPIATDDATKTITAPAHTLEYNPMKAATCDEAGWYAHYQCKVCGGTFWDFSTDEESIAPEKDITIPALGHLISPNPTFSWENEVTQSGPAQAVFSCIREGCGAKSVVKKGLTVAEDGTFEGDSKICGETATLSYPVETTFDREAITKAGDSYIYDETKEQNKIIYTGSVTKPGIISHDFSIEANTGDNEITGAVMTCSLCDETVTFDRDGKITDATGKLADTTGSMKVVSITSGHGYQAATCTAGGTDVYEITITCDTRETEPTGIKRRYEVMDYVTQPTSAKGHDYIAVLSPWNGDVTTSNGVTTPSGVIATVTCARGDVTAQEITGNSLHFVQITSSNEADNNGSGYVAATCTKGGTDSWNVTADYTPDGGSAITLPADDAEPLYVTKASVKLNHDYPSEATWNWEEYGYEDPYDPATLIQYKDLDETTAKVYATYTCQNPDCDGLSDGTPGKKVGTQWVKELEASVTRNNEGSTADCVNSGTVTYTATVDKSLTGGSEDLTKEQPFFVEATGHRWNASIDWGTWTLDGTTSVDGDTIPNYTITASVTCRNSFCSLPAVEGEHRLEISSAEQTLGGRIIIDIDHTPATCTTSGRTVYNAKAVFLDNGEILDIFMEGMDEHSKTETVLATGHDYRYEWALKGIDSTGEEVDVVEDGDDSNIADIAEYTSATVTRICSNEENDEGYEPTEQDAVITAEYEGGDKNHQATCTESLITKYTMEALGQKITRTIVTEALGHNYGWKVSVDWDEIEEGTTGVKAVYGCLNELPDDVWTDPDYASKIQDVTVVKSLEDSKEPTCTEGGTIVWDLVSDDGEQIGTHVQKVDPLTDAHQIEINWATLKATDRDTNGKVTYEVHGSIQCASGVEEHDVADVTLEATADFGAFDCTTPPQDKVKYTLRITDEIDPSIENVTIQGGAEQEMEYTAQKHEFTRVPAETGIACNQASYPSHYRCNHCGKTFRNSSTDAAEIVISKEPQGHRYGNPVFRWIEDGSSVVAVFTCQNTECPHEEVLGYSDTRIFDAVIMDDVMFTDVEATCEHEGTGYYPVKVDIRNKNIADIDRFTTTEYEEDVAVTLAQVNHVFETTAGGQKVCKWCGTQSDKVVKITFYDTLVKSITSTGWINVAQNPSESNIAIPSPQKHIGYTFDGWSFNGRDYTESAKAELIGVIQGALADAVGNGTDLEVQTRYTAVDDTATITATAIYPGGTKTISSDTATIGTNHPVEAAPTITVSGKTYYFSHWASMSDAEDSDYMILSTSKTYEVYVTSETDRDVYAFYVEDPDEKEDDKPTIAMTEVSAAQIGDDYKITFTVTMADVTEYGYTVVDSGILYGADQSWVDECIGKENEEKLLEQKMNLATDVAKRVLNGNKTNTLTANVKTDADKVVFARGYLRYTDGNEIYVVYTKVAYRSYNPLNSQL